MTRNDFCSPPQTIAMGWSALYSDLETFYLATIEVYNILKQNYWLADASLINTLPIIVGIYYFSSTIPRPCGAVR